jgi:hypothetical protein
MKKILAIMATLILSLTACAERQHLITYSQLPAQAQAFVQKYFNPTDVAYIEREREGMHYDYKVHFKNVTEIDFDYQGNLKSIDCEISPVPNGIVPDLIVNFVALHYPDYFIVEYAIGHRYVTIELGNGVDLLFDLEGHFVRVDD